MAPKAKEKAKATPTPTPTSASAPASQMEDLFTSLNRHIQNQNYEQAVKVSDQVLALSPGDVDAWRCKVVSLIKADNIDKALLTIQDSERKNRSIDFSFDKAYCLYRKNNLDEALESLKGKEETSATMLLESQILYRMGRMEACMDVYQKLQKFKIESLEINVVAGLVTAGRASEVQGMMDVLNVKPTSSFELAYNTACSFIEKTNYTDAEQYLLTARRIGQETLMEENWADDEIEIELAPITVQLAYVQQLLRHPQEAMETYLDVINKNMDDDLSLAVAINNLIALRGPKDASDGLRKIDKLIEKADESQGFQFARGLDMKLSSKQKEAICSNRVLLLLHANKIDQARELVAALLNMFPGSVMPILLQAAVLVRENKAGRAEEILGQFADKLPEKSKVLLMARATIAATAGHPQIAADSLLRIPEIQHMPATVATLVALKERVGDIDGASYVFDEAIRWWSNAMSEENKLDVIMNEAASFKLKHGREEEAAKLYEDLVKSHGSVEALVGLVTTAARVDVDKAEAYEKQLKPLPGLKGIELDKLEKTAGAEGGVRNVEVIEEGKAKTKTKKKRKRKPRYPKGFDPANPGPAPDPERWLPKRERSSYRPKRKDKRAAQVRGSQGAVSKEKQEVSATSTSSNVTNSKPNQPSTSKPEQPKVSSKSSRKKSRK
ncbi:hypothetical protein AQUCO_01100306v1 [Aquilegia coerulea]|uniref:Signal recognition particle subunit SRP72 n=1 Tax=Aquilegia coerulea TaxID=218851 RepID=A0A2G5E755_AQUCA|nr:hypothetical protein AQUCO_01100306v1 [Aquilegia coerulea]